MIRTFDGIDFLIEHKADNLTHFSSEPYVLNGKVQRLENSAIYCSVEFHQATDDVKAATFKCQDELGKELEKHQ